MDDSSVDYPAWHEQMRKERAVRKAQAEYGLNAADAEALVTTLGLAAEEFMPEGGMMMASYSYPAGSFYLKILSANATNASLILHGTTNDSYYELLSRESLTNDTWLSEGSLQGTTNQDFSPASLAVGSRTNSLFIRARLLTNGPTGTLPLWWQLEHFAQTGVDPSADFDSDGLSNLDEYSAGTDPNTIRFYPRFQNFYVNSNTATGSVLVQGGVPAQTAFVASSEEIESASWQPYSPTVEIPLLATDGVYTVWIGLRGLSSNSQPTWEVVRLTRDTAPPPIFITEPALTSAGTLTTSQPVIQLRGSSSEPLRGIQCSLTNADTATTDISAGVTRQDLDSATAEETTCWFACCDLRLSTNGPNIVTLRVKDRAGNMTTTNITITLDYSGDTTPPTLALQWPRDGDTVCGTHLDLRGYMDDPTATVTAQIVDGDGNTNSVAGLVELNGLVWVNGLPMGAGTNRVSLTMTDAAGNSSSTNLAVIRGSLNLTIDPVPDDQLIQPEATVTGTIDSAEYTVWVNGVKATNITLLSESLWCWQADGVPSGGGGTAVFEADAIPNSDNGGNGSFGGGGGGGAGVNPASTGGLRKNEEKDRPPYCFVEHYNLDYRQQFTWDGLWEEYFPRGTNIWWDQVSWTNRLIWLDWTNRLVFTNTATSSGTRNHGYFFKAFDAQNVEHESGETCAVVYPVDGYAAPALPTLPGQLTITSISNSAPTYSTEAPPQIALERWMEDWIWPDWDNLGIEQYRRIAETRIKLRTGGKRLSARQNMFRLLAWANSFPRRKDSTTSEFVNPEAITLRDKALTPLTNSPTMGDLYLSLPDNTEWDITPAVASSQRYTFYVDAAKYRLMSQCYVTSVLDPARTNLGVGEVVILSFTNSAPPAPVTWSATAGAMLTNGADIRFCAPSNATDAVTVSALVRDVTNSITFKVWEPTGVDHAEITSTTGVLIQPGVAGAWMHLNVFMAPTNVSLYRVKIWEEGRDASGIWGYFMNHPPQSHTEGGANVWQPVGYDNLVGNGFDEASYWGDGSQYMPSPWDDGGFVWEIPAKWKVGDAGQTNTMTGWSQTFRLHSDGAMTISKFGTNVTRTINNQITPSL